MQTMARSVIRPATADDISDIRAVLARANASFKGQVADPLFESYIVSVLDVERRAEEGDLLAAELDGRIVGTVTFYRDASDEGMPVRFPPRTSGLRATAVDPEVRGQGIGRALVEACIERASAERASAIGLHTATFMTAAIGLYERAGFRRAPELDFGWAGFFTTPTSHDERAIAYLRAIP